MISRRNIRAKPMQNTARDCRRVLQRGAVVAVSMCFLAICLILISSNATSKFEADRVGKPYRMVPEYERLMREVVISLAIRDKTLDLHSGLLQHLPDYTKILILLPKSNLRAITAELEDQPYGERTQLVSFDTKHLNNVHVYFIFPERDKLMDSGVMDGATMPQGTLWAQDLFEVATKPDGRSLLLVSDVHKWFTSHGHRSSLKVVSDNSYLGRLSSVGLEVQRLPLTFDGGNILVDEFGDRQIVICGGDMLRRTRTAWKSTRDSTPTNSEISSMLKKFLNADEVIVVGGEKVQPSLMFHLDQAMILLPNGVVGITNVVGKQPNGTPSSCEVKEVDVFLSELRSALVRLGYRLVNIDTSVRNVLNHQYYVNAIPYIDAKTSQRTLLMPVFPSTQTEFEKELVKKNTTTFESLGYKVVHVPTNVDKINGGIHCLVNVLE